LNPSTMTTALKIPTGIQETVWPDSLPPSQQTYFFSVYISEDTDELAWGFHSTKNENQDASTWRNTLSEEERDKILHDPISDISDSVAAFGDFMLTDPLDGSESPRDYIFGKNNPMTLETAAKAAVGRGNITVYILSTKQRDLDFISKLFSYIPCRLFLMKSHDFFTKYERADNLNIKIKRLAALRGAANMKGFPSIVLDAGDDMTYTAADSKGCVIGGAISPGLPARLNSINQKSKVTEDQLYQMLEGASSNKKPLPIFSNINDESVVATLLSEVSNSARYTIKIWEEHDVPEEMSDGLKRKASTYCKVNAEKEVMVTGKNRGLLHNLLLEKHGGLIQSPSSSEAIDAIKNTSKKTLITHGIHNAVLRQIHSPNVPQRKNSDDSQATPVKTNMKIGSHSIEDSYDDSNDAMEIDSNDEANVKLGSKIGDASIHIGKNVAKDFDGEIFIGVITDYKDGFWDISYEDGDNEDLDEEELKEVLEFFTEFSQKFIGKKIAKELHGKVCFGKIKSVQSCSKSVSGSWSIEYDDGFVENLDRKEIEKGLEIVKKKKKSTKSPVPKKRTGTKKVSVQSCDNSVHGLSVKNEDEFVESLDRKETKKRLDFAKKTKKAAISPVPKIVTEKEIQPGKVIAKGTRIAKYFGENVFLGEVTNYSEKGGGLYYVQYDDGDDEDFNEKELDEAMKLFDSLEAKESADSLKITDHVESKNNASKNEESNDASKHFESSKEVSVKSDSIDNNYINETKKKSTFEKAIVKGTRIAKYFDGEIFLGEVIKLPRRGGKLWHVQYEDGDDEDLDEEELDEVIKIFASEESKKSTAALNTTDDVESKNSASKHAHSSKEVTTKSKSKVKSFEGKKVTEVEVGKKEHNEKKFKSTKRSIEASEKRVTKKLKQDSYNDPKRYIKKRAAKNFKEVLHFGTIVNYEDGLWSIRYDDGDEEDLDENELEKAIALEVSEQELMTKKAVELIPVAFPDNTSENLPGEDTKEASTIEENADTFSIDDNVSKTERVEETTSIKKSAQSLSGGHHVAEDSSKEDVKEVASIKEKAESLKVEGISKGLVEKNVKEIISIEDSTELTVDDIIPRDVSNIDLKEAASKKESAESLSVNDHESKRLSHEALKEEPIEVGLRVAKQIEDGIKRGAIQSIKHTHGMELFIVKFDDNKVDHVSLKGINGKLFFAIPTNPHLNQLFIIQPFFVSNYYQICASFL